MTTDTSIVKYDTPRGEIVLSHEAVRALCPKATAGEVALFLRVCLYHRLNPFLREVYLVKYDERAPASIVIGKDTFTQRAEAHPAFKGFKAGLILERDGNVLEVAGSFLGARDTLLGGWAEVYRSDRDHPFRITVGIQEYNRNQSSWRSMPATMIRKVALVQALREAFPSLFVGLYDGSITDTSDAIEGEADQNTGAAPETKPQAPPPGQDQPTPQSEMPKQTPSLGPSPVPQGAAPKPEETARLSFPQLHVPPKRDSTWEPMPRCWAAVEALGGKPLDFLAFCGVKDFNKIPDVGRALAEYAKALGKPAPEWED